VSLLEYSPPLLVVASDFQKISDRPPPPFSHSLKGGIHRDRKGCGLVPKWRLSGVPSTRKVLAAASGRKGGGGAESPDGGALEGPRVDFRHCQGCTMKSGEG